MGEGLTSGGFNGLQNLMGSGRLKYLDIRKGKLSNDNHSWPNTAEHKIEAKEEDGTLLLLCLDVNGPG